MIGTVGPDCVCWPAPDRERDHIDQIRERLPAGPAAIRQLRRLMRSWVAAVALDDELAESIVLIVDEAVTNAVEHACPDRTCQIELVAGPRGCGDGVAVVVVDDGVWQEPTDPGYRGRGVTLIGQLAQRSTIETTEHGTVVRMCWPWPSDSPVP
ncbi:ATP-binding protein [Actinomycetospora endophytica]|uniref:ATP-binding protein n=1 Tax=Actinomycetospora endophytica TaxID=2291215 RepID=A0ABS8PD20_9PSEU|nr:ATP-binding protein [Actinomycetospora endophytica]MCD2195883.1 ATP-binding protein [Actinomycetospora endophytica]